jgi:hypothetical protein
MALAGGIGLATRLIAMINRTVGDPTDPRFRAAPNGLQGVVRGSIGCRAQLGRAPDLGQRHALPAARNQVWNAPETRPSTSRPPWPSAIPRESELHQPPGELLEGAMGRHSRQLTPAPTATDRSMSAIEVKVDAQSRADPDRIQAATLGANEFGYSRNSPKTDDRSTSEKGRVPVLFGLSSEMIISTRVKD